MATLLALNQRHDGNRHRSIFSGIAETFATARPTPTPAARRPPGPGRTLIATTLSPDDADQSAASAAKLIEAIQRSGAAPAADFVVLDFDMDPTADPPLARALGSFGWALLPRPPLAPRGPGPAAAHRAADLAPLHLWNLTAYDRVVFLASDCFVAGSLGGLLALDLDAHPLWIAPAAGRGAPPGTLDAGVLVLRPDAGDFDRLLAAAAAAAASAAANAASGGSEAVAGGSILAQILGKEFPRGRRGELGFGNNADIAVYTEDRARWDRAMSAGLNVVRYTVQKPWRCGGEYAEVCQLWAGFLIEGFQVEVQCEVTLVTAYFEMESKHSKDDYHEWMRSVLSLDACMVVVTAPSTVALFRWRDRQYTRIVQVELEEAGIRLNKTVEFWENQFKFDGEKFRHKSYKLYWVWALKPVFLQDAILSNVFKSQYFFWIDVGCLRDHDYDGRSLRTVPPQVQRFDSVFFSNVADFAPEDLRVLPDHTAANNQFSDHLAGAIWGGKASAVLAFHDAYFRVFMRLADSGGFIGKDQTVMNIACIENERLCMLVRPRGNVYNIWFYMIPFLLGDTPSDVPYALGPSLGAG